MANKKPVCKFPAKFPGVDGKAVNTRLVRMPEYLLNELEVYAQKLHQQRLAEGTVPAVTDGGDR